MLPDLERKLLRILSAYVYKHKQFPSMWILWRKTGRREADLFRSLKALKYKGYIEWEATRHTQAQLLKEWEDGALMRLPKENRAVDPWEMESF